MTGKFGAWEAEIKDFCIKNSVDFDEIEKMDAVWGIDCLDIRKNGENVLTVSRLPFNKASIEITDMAALPMFADK